MKSIKELIARSRSNDESLSPEERRESYLLLFMLLLFLAAAVFSMKNFFGINSLTERISVKAAPVDDKAAAEAARAGKMLNAKLMAFRRLREETPQLAELAESIGRSPVSVVTPPPKIAAETRVPEFVPELRIKALVVLGDNKICTLDIDGEEPNQIYKPGMTFGGGKGRIVSIDTKGVNWKWANKNYRADL